MAARAKKRLRKGSKAPRSGDGKVADIRAVAARAGVSISTVSRFMNGKAVRRDAEPRIAEAVKALGYRPNNLASSLKSRRTNTLGMVVPDITNPFFPEVVKGAEAAARAAGFHIILSNSDESPEEELNQLETLRALRCDALMIAPSSGQMAAGARERLEALGVPIVFVDRRPGWRADIVTTDNVAASEEAVTHLIRLGHRRIALLHPHDHASTHLERAQGFRKAMAAAGLEVPSSMLIAATPDDAEAASALVKALRGPAPPTALFVTSNRLTVAAVGSLGALGLRCPDDVALVAYDDYPWAKAFQPRLTAVAQPASTLGQRAVQMLLARLAAGGEGGPEEVVLRSQLIVRESCGVYLRRPPSERV